MEFEPKGSSQEVTWTKWQFFISQLVTILVTVFSLWYAAQSGFEIAKKSDRYFELRQATNMMEALMTEIKGNIENIRNYQNKIGERMKKLKGPRHRRTLPYKLKIRQNILHTTVEKDFLYVVNGKTLSMLYTNYDRIKDMYKSKWGEDRSGRKFLIVYTKKAMKERIQKYEKLAKDLDEVHHQFERQVEELREEMKTLE